MISAFAVLASGIHADHVQSSIRWLDGSPQLELKFAGKIPETVKEFSFSAYLYNSRGDFLWEGTGRATPTTEGPWTGSLQLPKLETPGTAHWLEMVVFEPRLNLFGWEKMHFAAENSTLQHYSLRRLGSYPDQKLFAAFRFNKASDPGVRKFSLVLSLKDSDENVVVTKIETIPVAPEGGLFQADITPVDLRSVGPYTLECSIENDVSGVYFNWTERAAFTNALIPVTSFEIDDLTWFTATTSPDDPRLEGLNSAPLPGKRFPRHIRSYHQYASPQLYRDAPFPYPKIHYDPKESHSGRQSLRVDYEPGKVAHVYSLQTLPGFPTAARIWIKGNQTQDRVALHWCDQTDLMIGTAWGRYLTKSYHEVCRLNFEGWKAFELPVLGDGLQFKTHSGNTEKIEVPIHVFALSIHPESGGPPARSVWLDDLIVEAQARDNERVTLELRADTPDRLLHENASLHVSLGNGSGGPIQKGRLQLIARDRSEQTVQEILEIMDLPAASFCAQEFHLSKIFAQSPPGPVDIDVSFADPRITGLRTSARITFKNPQSLGLFWDFEAPASYNGAFRGSGAQTVPGGAQGSARALLLRVESRQEPPGSPPSEPKEWANSTLLHPALPGLVDRVELLVRAVDRPVELEAVLLDSGRTGVANKNVNEFWLPRIRVDWQDWRKVEFVSPPVPIYYGDKTRWFFRKPWYPLNLVLRVLLSGDGAAGVLLDNIRVRTHLVPEEELLGRLLFPDESRIHFPGSPLLLALTNFSSIEKTLPLRFQLQNFQGKVDAAGAMDVRVSPGEKITPTLIESLAPGVYDLTVQGLDGKTIREIVQVLDATQYFGPDPVTFLADLSRIRHTLGMTVENVYLDWDNTEPVPGLFHDHWFRATIEEKAGRHHYSLRPVVGFSADWAGQEAQEAIARGDYLRYTPNNLQAPVRMADWDCFVREVLREYKGQFADWVFWENPDLRDNPQYIPPDRYPQMLRIFKQWVSEYDPKARVVAGGFNMDKALDYLEQIENPWDLPFDALALRMNVGELSPEDTEIEAFLDELHALLKLQETRRQVEISELDWGIGPLVSPLQHAAYHARASLILHSRGSSLHHFSPVNVGETFEGYGILYRIPYGNSENVQTFKPTYLPKPAYFALAFVRDFLSRWKFTKSVRMPDSDPENHRAFLFKNSSGEVTTAIWRTRMETRSYRLPPSCKGAKASDAFGFPVLLEEELRCTPLPAFLQLPPGTTMEQLSYDLRHLSATDGKDAVILDLHVSEPDSCARAYYSAAGNTRSLTKRGRPPGGRNRTEAFLDGIDTEQFEFLLERPGNVLLTRGWAFYEKGSRVKVSLNGRKKEWWDLSLSDPTMEKGDHGVRESTFLLRNCQAGKNIVSISYETPGNCSSYRLESLEGNFVDLTRWGILNAVQTKGEVQRNKSAVGTPLMIGKRTYASGLGTHSIALVEVPLDGQFSSFEVTVGIDSFHEGRGSVIFEIHIDGIKKESCGPLNGFTEPKTLKIDSLDNARRMVLLVRDAGDGNQDDLADWVNGKLFLKEEIGP